MMHGRYLKLIPIDQAPKVWFEIPEVIKELFVAFHCEKCGKYYYMLKADYERRLINGGPSIDLSNLEERGVTYFKENDQWVLLYTIIS